MKVVDAHFHIWDLQENYYPWLVDEPKKMILGDYGPIRRNYLISDFFEDASCIDLVAAVHIQAEHDEADHVRETRWLQGVADSTASHGFPQAIVANCDFAAPDIEAVLEAHCQHPNMRGIRRAVHRWLHADTPYDPLRDPVWTGNFGLLRKFGLSFDHQAFPEQIEDSLALMRRYPDIQFILTHLGLPLWRDASGMERWHDNIRKYAEMSNCAIKISGFGMSDQNWTAQSIRPLVEHAIEHFGIGRCALASNFPVEGLHKPYAEVWSAYRELFASYSADEQASLFAGTALRLYRIESTAG